MMRALLIALAAGAGHPGGDHRHSHAAQHMQSVFAGLGERVSSNPSGDTASPSGTALRPASARAERHGAARGAVAVHARPRAGLPALANRRTRVRVRLDAATITLNLRTTDFVIFEVLTSGAYTIPGLFDGVRTVLDGGANIGCFALFAAQFAPEATFVCVEPDPSSVRILRDDVRDNGLNATVLHAGLADGDGPMLVTDEVLGHTNCAWPAVDGAAGGLRVAGVRVGRALDVGGLARAGPLQARCRRRRGRGVRRRRRLGRPDRNPRRRGPRPAVTDGAASALAAHGLQEWRCRRDPIFENMLLMRAPR